MNKNDFALLENAVIQITFKKGTAVLESDCRYYSGIISFSIRSSQY